VKRTFDIRVLVLADQQSELNELTEVVQGVGMETDLVLGTDYLPSDRFPHGVAVVRVRSPQALGRISLCLRKDAIVVALVDPDAHLAHRVDLFARLGWDHIISAEGNWKSILGITLWKVASGHVFGIEKYMPQGTEIHLLRLTSYRGRSRAIDRIISFAEQARFRASQRQSVAQVCEELLMNALYNAPVDNEGQKVFAEVEPKKRLEMKSPKPVSIRYAASGDLLALAVRDRFGTLRKETVIQYLRKCLDGRDQIDRKTSGAGLGLYLVTSRSALYVNNIAPGVATEAVVVFDKRRRKTGTPAALGFFLYDKEVSDSHPLG